MLATVTWIESLAAINLLLFLPAATRTLKLPDQLSLITALQKGLLRLALHGHPAGDWSFQVEHQPTLRWLSFHQHPMVAVHSYQAWVHAVIMVVVSAIQTWEVTA